ncbi:MAG: MoaD family protein [Candidatus Methanomethylicia archaeon]|nr:MoaD family protein [Candidatus Methanomethylicia archaeon]
MILISFLRIRSVGMKVKAEFYADLREVAGGAALEIEFAGETVMDLVMRIDDLCGGGFKERVVEGDQIKPMVKIFVNGRDVRGLKGLETSLRDGDNVAFFPPVAGG